MDYPFLNVIDKLLSQRGKTKEWLAKEIGVSYKTLFNKDDIREVSFSYISKLNRSLQFDFLKDYNDWVEKNNGEKIYMVSEPAGEYKTVRKTMTMSLSVEVTGTREAIAMHFVDLLDAIKKEGDKHGIEIK